MNAVIAVLLCFALLGAVDKLIGNRMGLAEEFDRGLTSMGPLALSMSGIYCIGIALVQRYQESFQALAKFLPFDVSLLVGGILAPDLGGYAISTQLASAPQVGSFSGVLVSSMLGCTISFILPISLGVLKEDQVREFMHGILFGVITIPVGLFAGGLLLGMNLAVLWSSLWPVLVLCAVLCLLIFLFPVGAVKALSGVGTGIRLLSIVLFCITAATAFLPQIGIVSQELLMEALLIALKITVVVCGSMVACRLLLRHGGGVLNKIANLMGINQYAVIGLFGSLATSIAMLPFFDQMDPRGKVMNAAFAVSGAFVFGGQLAFISSVEAGSITSFIVAKLLAGIAAVAAAALFTGSKKEKRKGAAILT